MAGKQLDLLAAVHENAESMRDAFNKIVFKEELGHQLKTLGQINAKQTHVLLFRLGLSSSPETSRRVFNEVDETSSGYVTLEELSRALWSAATEEMESLVKKSFGVVRRHSSRSTQRLLDADPSFQRATTSVLRACLRGIDPFIRNRLCLPSPLHRAGETLALQASRVLELFKSWDANFDGACFAPWNLRPSSLPWNLCHALNTATTRSQAK